MDLGQSLDAQVQQWSASAARACGIALVSAVFVLDVCMTVLIHQSPSWWAVPVEWTYTGFREGFSDIKHETFDLLALCAVRLLVVSCLAYVAVRLGSPNLDDLVKAADQATCVVVAPTEPLLINGAGAASSAAATGARRLQSEVEEKHLISYQRKQAAELRKNCAVGTLYLASTACQVYLGIKCIGFDGAWKGHSALRTMQGALLFASVVLINVEAFALTRCVNAATREEGFLVPEFHPHTLYFRPRLFGNKKCDKCRNRIKQSYQCTLCSFDWCKARLASASRDR